MRFRNHSGERCGRANSWSDAQENILDPDADPTSEEKSQRNKEEIANPDTNFIGFAFTEKKEKSISRAGGIAVAEFQKEKSFAVTNGNAFPSSKEKNIANTAAF